MAEPKTTILVVDDEPNIRRILQAAFERDGHRVLVAENGCKAIEVMGKETPDLVLSDVVMPDMGGSELLVWLRDNRPEIVPVLMTSFGTIPAAVHAMRLGAFDYVSKPFDLDVLKKVIAAALEDRGSAKPKKKRGTKGKALDVIAVGPKMQAVMQMIEQVADSRATVLLTGESGTGKEVIAKALHEQSARSGKLFVALSCAAIPETLLEAELFGHEKGAFTGAAGQRIGRFEAADGGTLFLDEIGEVPAGIQVKLLRVIQEREIVRLGSTKPIKVDVRMVAATNRNLQEAVDAGTFRLDLYYRLQVVAIELPPLRERPEDLPVLAEHFMKKYNAENSRSLTTIHPAALAALHSHRWPGNVRELENVIERAVVLSKSDATEITLDLLPPTLKAA